MILKIFSVFDKQVDAYMQPFFSPTIGSAIRAMTDALNNPDSGFARNALDYTLYQLGEFDDGSGRLTPSDPQRVAPLSDLIKS